MIDAALKIGMATLLVAALPSEPAEPGLWAQWGLAGAVVAYVLWRDAQREQRMAEAIERQQTWVRNTLMHALERNAHAMERVVAYLERWGDDHA
ncbi:MAG: hypothetical protein H0X38_05150 [Planctomycetes bacterium]|nr:hypothetical protein [Planctomycetota bacterium]